MTMFKLPILLYSSLCPFSKQLLDNIPEHVLEKIIIVNIDRHPTTKDRPRVYYDIQELFQNRITVVPTLVMSEEKILQGRQVFDWVKSNHHSQPKPQPQSQSQPKQPTVPKMLTSESVENYTSLSSATFDTRPVTKEEAAELLTNQSTNFDSEKSQVNNTFEEIMEQRRKETEEIQKNKMVY